MCFCFRQHLKKLFPKNFQTPCPLGMLKDDYIMICSILGKTDQGRMFS